MKRDQHRLIDQWTTTHVWYSPDWDVWMVTAFTPRGHQIGESDTYTLKDDAVDMAKAYLDSDRCESVEVYGKNRKLQRVIK